MSKPSEVDLFELLFRQHYEQVFRVVRAYTKDQFIAEDAVQQAFIIAFKKLSDLQDKNKFANWVTVIALNESKRIFKKKSEEKVVYLTEIELSSHNNVEALEVKQDIEGLLRKLKKQDLEILILKYFSDLTLQQISEVLGINLSNSKVRLHRARESFRRLFERDNQDIGGGL